jgi:FKBP-type peptidyl-prolyl cis-trans isomerase FklB
MRRIIAVVFPLALVALGACQGQSGAPSLNTEDQKASYGIGLQMGEQLQAAESRLDLNAYMAGIRDGMAGREPAVPEAEIESALMALGEAIQEEELRRYTEDADRNAQEGAAFLAENETKEGVRVTENGLQYEVLREGDGDAPDADDRVSVHYRGTLIDGTQFDSSYDRGDPAVFGVGGVIAGFAEALQLMTVGSHYRVFIPSELAYGPQGSGGAIGPNATLILEIELLEIVE